MTTRFLVTHVEQPEHAFSIACETFVRERPDRYSAVEAEDVRAELEAACEHCAGKLSVVPEAVTT